jgi:ApaG protein
VNLSTQTVQLMTRHWFITDGAARSMRSAARGVVGKQPVLRPGESFNYTSGCPLTTPDGSMHGFYAMQDENGTIFDVEVPLFPLDSPM